jgi:hypothetical protein
MARWRCGSKRTNMARMCLWCGRPLRRDNFDTFNKSNVVTHAARLSDNDDAPFCGLRCGYMFGLSLAQQGHRLTAKVRATL